MTASCEGKQLALIIMITKGITFRLISCCERAVPPARQMALETHKPTSIMIKSTCVFSSLNISIQLHNASLLPFYNREICKKKNLWNIITINKYFIYS